MKSTKYTEIFANLIFYLSAMELLIINLRNGHRFRRDNLPNLFTAQRGDVRYRVRFLPARVGLHPD